MKITLLGTGSPIPDPNRAGPSSLVASENTTVLVDAGRACVQRLVGAGGRKNGNGLKMEKKNRNESHFSGSLIN